MSSNGADTRRYGRFIVARYFSPLKCSIKRNLEVYYLNITKQRFAGIFEAGNQPPPLLLLCWNKKFDCCGLCRIWIWLFTSLTEWRGETKRERIHDMRAAPCLGLRVSDALCEPTTVKYENCETGMMKSWTIVTMKSWGNQADAETWLSINLEDVLKFSLAESLTSHKQNYFQDLSVNIQSFLSL